MNRTALFITAFLLLTGCGEESPRLHGYAEGKFMMLAPDSPGRLTAIGAAEGARLEAGAVLFRVEDTVERASLQAAKSNAEAVAARFEDAAAGGRDQEIVAAREQLEQARAAQRRAGQDAQRTQDLFNSGTVPRAKLDEAVAAVESADARVAELRQRLTLVQLPARENQLRALASAAKEAQAQLQSATEMLARRTIAVPSTGRIERIIRYPGEIAGPNAPAVRFLPDGAVYAVLFIPEPRLAQTPVGTRLRVLCDGCPEDATAEITSIANEAEFTPPVIYSESESARLVFRAEARFTSFAPPPGTPLRTEPAT